MVPSRYLEETWRPTARRFAQEPGFWATVARTDGSWAIGCGPASASFAILLRDAPGDFRIVSENSTWLTDVSEEEVDVEQSETTWACNDERVLITKTEQWLSGTTFSVTYYASQNRYVKAVNALPHSLDSFLG